MPRITPLEAAGELGGGDLDSHLAVEASGAGFVDFADATQYCEERLAGLKHPPSIRMGGWRHTQAKRTWRASPR